jgi:hypothetical protein
MNKYTVRTMPYNTLKKKEKEKKKEKGKRKNGPKAMKGVAKK